MYNLHFNGTLTTIFPNVAASVRSSGFILRWPPRARRSATCDTCGNTEHRTQTSSTTHLGKMLQSEKIQPKCSSCLSLSSVTWKQFLLSPELRAALLNLVVFSRRRNLFIYFLLRLCFVCLSLSFLSDGGSFTSA